MELSHQTQKAGANAQQLQAQTVIINNGITEERAREVCREECKWAIQEYTQDAYQTANARVERLEDSLIPRILRLEGSLAYFADPAFQMTLRKAQQTAACTERENDYELLAELLICHIQKGQDRKHRASVVRAIEIIDELDNDALCALTLFHAVSTYIPTTGICRDGLNVLNNLFGKLMYMPLPTGEDWIEHLDQLGAVRMSDFGSLKKFSDFYSENLSGYACAGIKRDSEGYEKACTLLKSKHMNTNILLNNECLEGFVRLPVRNKEAIGQLKIENIFGSRPINREEIGVLEQIWDLYSAEKEDKKTAKDNFMKIWDSFENLRQLRIWWEAIHGGVKITHIGKILAYTNARRCDPSLPELSL